jgi:hypothetical protein
MGGLLGPSRGLDRFCFVAWGNKETPLFWRARTDERRTTHSWVRNATRLYQNDPLQELDSGKLHASLRIRRPHELDDPALHASERIPQWPFGSIGTPILKEKISQLPRMPDIMCGRTADEIEAGTPPQAFARRF